VHGTSVLCVILEERINILRVLDNLQIEDDNMKNAHYHHPFVNHKLKMSGNIALTFQYF